MTRLTNSETGVTVSVDEEAAAQMQESGWKPAEAPAPEPAPKAPQTKK